MILPFPFFKSLAFLCAFVSAFASAQRFDHVFDIDDVIATVVSPRAIPTLSPEESQRLVKIRWPMSGKMVEQSYLLAPGFLSYIQELRQDTHNRISFFSAGMEERNVELLGAIHVDEKTTLLDLAKGAETGEQTRVFSEGHVRESWDKPGLFKDLNVLDGVALDRVILYDDKSRNAFPGQEKNLLLTLPIFGSGDTDETLLKSLESLKNLRGDLRDMHTHWLGRNAFGILKKAWKDSGTVGGGKDRLVAFQRGVLDFNKGLYDRISKFEAAPTAESRSEVQRYLSEFEASLNEKGVPFHQRSFSPVLPHGTSNELRSAWCEFVLRQIH